MKRFKTIAVTVTVTAPCMAAYFLAPFNSLLTLMAYNRLTSFPKTFLNTLWPSYRGKRAGRLVKERERVSMKQIAVVSTRKVSGCPWFSALLHFHKAANCIPITPASTDEKRKSSPKAYVPSLFVANVMSLAPKVDELRHLVKYANLDLVCITESGLKSHIHDNVVALESYNIIRRDRRATEHGVYACISRIR